VSCSDGVENLSVVSVFESCYRNSSNVMSLPSNQLSCCSFLYVNSAVLFKLVFEIAVHPPILAEAVKK